MRLVEEERLAVTFPGYGYFGARLPTYLLRAQARRLEDNVVSEHFIRS